MKGDGQIENKCAGCGNLFCGDFCNACGQKVVPRFTGSYLWELLREDIVGIESGLMHTFKELWKRPGKMILQYVNGATRSYYGPIKYLAFWFALYLVVLALLNRGDDDVRSLWELITTSSGAFSGASLTDFTAFLQGLMERHSNLYILGIIPFLSATAYGFFRGKKFNFTEIVIFYTYFYGQFVFCAVVANTIDFLFLWTEIRFSTPIIFASYFYLFFRMQQQFFNADFKLSLLKGVGIWLLSTFLYWSFLFLGYNGIKYLIQG